MVASKFMDSEGRQSLAASHRQLVGHLMDPNGRVIREFSSDASEKGKADRVTLQVRKVLVLSFSDYCRGNLMRGTHLLILEVEYRRIENTSKSGVFNTESELEGPTI